MQDIKTDPPFGSWFWKDCLPSQAAHSRPHVRQDATAAFPLRFIESKASVEQRKNTKWLKDVNFAMEVDLSKLNSLELPTRPSSNTNCPSVFELVQSLRAERRSQQRHAAACGKLLNASYKLAMSFRMIRHLQDSRTALTDCLLDTANDRFVTILDSTYDINDGYDDLRQSQRTMYPQTSKVQNSSPNALHSSTSFLASLSSAARRDVLDILLTVRDNPEYVADRICCLRDNDLLELVQPKPTASSNISALNVNTRKSQGSLPRESSRMHVGEDSQGQREPFNRMDPFSALMFMPFDGPSESSKAEELKRTQLACSICRRLILSSRIGADQFVLRVLDTWTALRKWPGKKTFELFLLEAMEQADQFVRRPSHNYANIATSSNDKKELQMHVQSSVESFYSMLASPSISTLLPTGFLEIARSLCSSLQDAPGQKSYLKHLIICKWLFARFFNETIRLPEKNGILLDRYISIEARAHFLVPLSNEIQDLAFQVFYDCPLDGPAGQVARSVLSTISTEIEKCPTVTRTNALDAFQDDTPVILLVHPSEIISLSEILYSPRNSLDPFFNYVGRGSSCASLAGLSCRSFSAASTTPSASFILSQNASSATSISSQTLGDDISEVVRLDRPSMHLHTSSTDSDLGARLLALSNELKDRYLSVVETGPDTSDFDVILLDNEGTEKSSLYWKDAIDSAGQNGLQGGSHAEQIGEFMEDGRGKSLHSLLKNILSDPDTLQLIDSWGKVQVPTTADSLQDLLKHAATIAKETSDMRTYHKLIWADQTLSEYDVSQKTVSKMLSNIKTTLIDTHRLASKHESAMLDISLKQDTMEALAQEFSSDINHLRDKMWFMTDVKNSGPYEDARTIALALRMASEQTEKRKETVLSKFKASARPWMSNSTVMRTEIDVMDLLTAPQVQGGYGKLADEQVELLRTWIRQENIDTSLCKGEERLFRLFMEISRCITQLAGSSLMENPVLWTSDLFRRERDKFTVGTAHPIARSPRLPSETKSQDRSSGVNGSQHRGGMDGGKSKPQDPATSSSQTRPGLRLRSEEWQSRRTFNTHEFISRIRHSLTGFLFCDLVRLVFPEGSETDKWIRSELVAKPLVDSSSVPAVVPRSGISSAVDAIGEFSYKSAMQHYLRLFGVQSDPYAQVESLVNLHAMAFASMTGDPELYSPSSSPEIDQKQTLAVVHMIRDLLHDTTPLPKSLFCNLQYISIFTNSQFWEPNHANSSRLAVHHFSLAAVMLKQSVCESLVIAADDIVAFHTQHRGHHDVQEMAPTNSSTSTGSLESTSRPLGPSKPHRTMAAAAQLWLITAKEGLPIAQRELATFYLTHPDLLPRATLPLVPPRAVFRPERLAMQTDLDPAARTDPYTMCVAVHWMEESARGGDPLAMGFLQNREELGAIG